MSRETLTIVENLGLTEAQKADQAQTIAGLKRYVQGRINETVERRNFRQRKQAQGETFDDYLVSLRELAKTCNFCNNNCLQSNLRDQLVDGVSDPDTVCELLKEQNLTLEKAIDVGRAMETAKKELQSRPGMATATSASTLGESLHTVSLESDHESINAVSKYKQTNGKGAQVPTRGESGPCRGCGQAEHPEGRRKSCPAFTSVCSSCGKTGHYHAVCHQRPKAPSGPSKKPPPQTNSLSLTGPRQVGAPRVRHPGMMSLNHADPAPTLTVHIKALNGQAMVEALPDSGANICAAGVDFLAHIKEHTLNLLPSEVKPRAVNGSILSPIGSLKAVISVGNRSVEDHFHIYKSVSGVILSWRAAKSLGILPPTYPEPLPEMPGSSAILSAHLPPQSCDRPPTVTKEDLMKEFPTVFDGQIRTMPGEVFKIVTTDEAKPFCVNTPRTIPYAHMGPTKDELQLLESQSIISKQTEPTDWCAPIVVAKKKDSARVRLCVDFSPLNRFVKRERFQSTPPAVAVANIAKSKAKYFTVLDAIKGYHQCPLDKDSQHLTTFITPFGRYKFMRAPFGLSSISEHYDRRMYEAFQGLSDFRRIVDDILIFDEDPTSHVNHVRQFLQRCEDRGISLGRDKFQFCQTEVDFAGFHLSQDGYRISDDITQAISGFPTPSSRTDLRSFFGLVNQLTGSSDRVSSALAPLRPLLSTRNDFVWDTAHTESFLKAKEVLTTAPTLAFYDVSRPTRLLTDASRLGLGFVLQQEHHGEWKLVQAGSRFLTDAETRYAVIELELLAVAWAAKKCRIFLSGLPTFTVITDHNPLVPILNNHRLDEIENPRLQRLHTHLLAYSFIAKWQKGKDNDAADALSRHPYSQPAAGEDMAEFKVDIGGPPSAIKCLQSAEIRAMHGENLRVQELQDHARDDREYQDLLQLVQTGFPDHKSDLPVRLKKFWGSEGHLSVDDNLLVYGCRLFIPSTFRPSILERLHEAHQGITRSKDRARLTVYWPGIDQDIEGYVANCKLCQDSLPSHPREPIVTKPRPSRPFQEIAMDFAYHGGKYFLVVVDCLTDWPHICPMGSNTTSSCTINVMRGLFCRTAAPDVIWSDGGPQFTSSKFQAFLKDWGIRHEVSSPHYPQSNGKAESTLKSMKQLIKAAWRRHSVDLDIMAKALLQYRNTPCRRDGMSPAQKLYGCPIQDSLPAHRRSFAPEWQRPVRAERATEVLEKAESFYDQHAHALTGLAPGAQVAIQNPTSKAWDVYGVIAAVGPHRRYFVRTQSGRVLVRNRRFLRKRTALSICAPSGPAQGSPGQQQHLSQPSPLPLPAQLPPRRSERAGRGTRRHARLVEDDTWA